MTAKLLLVDDQANNLVALCEVLRREDVELLQAHSGPEALELLLKHDVALAVLDVQMPVMDGLELAELMRGVERTRYVPIIFVTASVQDRACHFRGYEAGAVDFIVKPIEPEVICGKVQVFLDLYRQRRELAEQRDELRRLLEEKSALLDARTASEAQARASEAALRESDNRLRLALAGGRMGAWDVDLDTGETKWDAKECELLGLEPGSVRPSAEEFYRRMVREDVARVKRAVAQAVETSGELDHEFRIVGPDGGVRWLAAKGLVLKDERGRARRMVGINYDVTERKEMETRLRSFAEELEARVDDRTRDLLRSQEQLRSLATELNLAEQRERQRLATELHDHLQQMLVLGKLKLGQGKRLAESIPGCAKLISETDDVLSEALQYTRTLVAELSPPVLRDHGLAAGLTWLAEYMKKHEVAVTVTMPEDDGWNLPQDQSMLLFQSVRELLINSAKHAGTHEAGVRVELEAGRLIIEVKDEGAGFDVVAAAAAAATPPGGLSSKFGLFSIRERMKALGGSFDIQSAPGKGTTATLVLPLSRRDVRDKRDEQTSPSKPVSPLSPVSRVSPHATIRVLLVDDHLMVREGLRAVLESYEDVELIGEAANGEEAITLVAERRPAVVVMDINMPKMNGIEATAQIKARAPETIVIGLSVNAGGENQDAMKQAGAALLLTKEAAVEQLYRAMTMAMDGKALQHNQRGRARNDEAEQSALQPLACPPKRNRQEAPPPIR